MVVYFMRCALPRQPATTDPVAIPMRILTRGALSADQEAFSSSISRRMASAQRRALVASCLISPAVVRGKGTPKFALIASP